MSRDVDDLGGWVPEGDSWALGLTILAGPDDGPGEESFDITVCSLGWLAERVRRDGVYDGRHHLVTEGWNWAAIRGFVERRVRACQGATWDDVAAKLARLGYWEFEGYDSHS